MDSGEGDTTGNKWSLKMNVDAGSISTDYRRYWKQIGSKERVEQIETKITVYKDKYEDKDYGTVIEKQGSVIGFAFGLNKDSAITNGGDSNTVGFYLLGYKTTTGKFYLEQYDEVNANAETLDTTESALTKNGNDDTTPAQTKSYDFDSKKWIDAATKWGSLKTTTDSDGNTVFYVILKQTGNGTADTKKDSTDVLGNYQLYVSDKELTADEITALTSSSSYYVAECDGQVFDSDGSAQGGLAVYGNGYKGDNVVALYEQNKDTLKGNLYDEVVEE